MREKKGSCFECTLASLTLTIFHRRMAFGMIKTYISRYLQLKTHDTHSHTNCVHKCLALMPLLKLHVALYIRYLWCPQGRFRIL